MRTIVATLALTALLAGCTATETSSSQAPTPMKMDPLVVTRDVTDIFSHDFHYKTGADGHVNASLRWSDQENVLKISGKFTPAVKDYSCGGGGGGRAFAFSCDGPANAWVTFTVSGTRVAGNETYTLRVTTR